MRPCFTTFKEATFGFSGILPASQPGANLPLPFQQAISEQRDQLKTQCLGIALMWPWVKSQNSVLPVNIPIQPPKIGSKMSGEFTYQPQPCRQAEGEGGGGRTSLRLDRPPWRLAAEIPGRLQGQRLPSPRQSAAGSSLRPVP